MTNGFFNEKYWPKASTGSDSYFNDLYFGHFGVGVSGFIYILSNVSSLITSLSSVSSKVIGTSSGSSKTITIDNSSLG